MYSDKTSIDKEELLCALFDAAWVNGCCVSEQERPCTVEEAGYDRSAGLSIPEARHYLELHGGDFTGKDIRGRWLEVDLSGEDFDLSAFSEHFGVGGYAIVREIAERRNSDDPK